MKVTYTGEWPVDIPSLQVAVAPGESIDVDDATGAQLVAQGWKPAKPAKGTPDNTPDGE